MRDGKEKYGGKRLHVGLVAAFSRTLCTSFLLFAGERERVLVMSSLVDMGREFPFCCRM